MNNHTHHMHQQTLSEAVEAAHSKPHEHSHAGHQGVMHEGHAKMMFNTPR